MSFQTFKVLLRLLLSECRAGVSRAAHPWLGLALLVLSSQLFAIALAPLPTVLPLMGPAVVLVMLVYAALIHVPYLFASDVDEGIDELMLLLPLPWPLIFLVKVLRHWLLTIVPLLVLVPLLLWGYGVPASVIETALWALLFATPSISLLGTLVAALLVNTKSSGFLIILLVLPLTVPVLIFTMAAMTLAADGQAYDEVLQILMALSGLSLVTCLWAAVPTMRLR